MFENLTAYFLRNDPLLSRTYRNVRKWGERSEGVNRTDTGIDLVAELSDETGGGVCAIQCKFYDLYHKVSKADLDSFFTESGKEPYTRRLIVTTSELGPTALEALQNQQIQVQHLTLDRFAQSPIDWKNYNPRKTQAVQYVPKKVQEGIRKKL